MPKNQNKWSRKLKTPKMIRKSKILNPMPWILKTPKKDRTSSKMTTRMILETRSNNIYHKMKAKVRGKLK